MYYVNVEQIEMRLAYVPELKLALEELRGISKERPLGRLERLALERALHLAVEVVTDVGSLMIDGYLMRDAGSYEDIVEILREDVLAAGTADELAALVKLRKPLVQQYMELTGLEPFLHTLPETIVRFAAEIRTYIKENQ